MNGNRKDRTMLKLLLTSLAPAPAAVSALGEGRVTWDANRLSSSGRYGNSTVMGAVLEDKLWG